jgi:transposase InsO family protein
MDFVADSLFNGRCIRALTVVDNFSRECLAITVDHGLRAEDVVATVEHIKAMRRAPDRIQVDNGSEFISKALDQWAYENNVILDFSRSGKPTDNAYIESFNGSFRDECLNMHWFLSLTMPDRRSKLGVLTTMSTGRTVHLVICPRTSSSTKPPDMIQHSQCGWLPNGGRSGANDEQRRVNGGGGQGLRPPTYA